MKSYDIKINNNLLHKWQLIINTLAQVFEVPAALIMRLQEKNIEVFVSSNSKNNPYHPGDSEFFENSGLYCETVIKTNNELLVPDATIDKDWKDNPDIKLNMISYLGYPITLPDGKPFGTICVLDSKNNAYNDSYKVIMENFRDVVQSQLELVYLNQELGEENKTFKNFIDEIKVLRGFLSICSICKKIKDDSGNWVDIETYIHDNSDLVLSHGFCNKCGKDFYKEHWISE